ncbi:MAG: DMT family transporter [Acidimicrobiales bacterium]
MSTPTRSLRTADGTNTGAFGLIEWSMLGVVALIWGSSFLWIAIGLDSLHPGAVAFLRSILGAVAMSFVPASRRPVERSALPVIAIIGVFGTLAPALFFAFAEQRIESSVAGMVQSAAPLVILFLAVVMSRKSPGRIQVVGLFIGFGGGVLLALPNVVGSDAQPLGVLLVLGAITCYSVSSNLLPPVVQEFGGPAVMTRALWISSILLFPYGLWGLANSSFAWSAVLAMTILGVFGTGLARTVFAELIGRAGAPRASMVSYFVPVVAVILGVTFRSDTVSAMELLGLAVILSSAWLISRAQTASSH